MINVIAPSKMNAKACHSFGNQAQAAGDQRSWCFMMQI
jgi:hypothetical protein